MNFTPENYGIVKTATIAVSIDPTDWQIVDEKSSPRTKGPTLLGCDFAGIVVEIGKGVRKEWKKGDRIAGTAHGGNDIEPEDGTFATYIVVKGDVAFHIPDNISFEEAVSLGVGVTTVALGFYKYLSLPLLTLPLSMPNPESKLPILIYGGSSTTGTLAAQFAKLSGLQVITTSSPRNFELLKSLATQSSAQICANALSTSGENIHVNLIGIEMPRNGVKNVFFLGYSVTGEEYEIEGEVWPATPEDFELGKGAFVLFERLLENGLIKNHPMKIMNGGLKGILEGMREMKEGNVSGEKLVYRVGEP
ncbi:hypothetical protein EAF00_006806 [Botryotinia globosa]|nr:hypothetical protein EAF00_006806 [Botryotinia globosa]